MPALAHPGRDVDVSGWCTEPPVDVLADAAAGHDPEAWVLGAVCVLATTALLACAVAIVGPAPPPIHATLPPALVDAAYARLDDDPAAAAEQFHALLQLAPRHARARLGLGEAELAAGRDDAAVAVLCPLVGHPGAVGATAASALARHGGVGRCP